MTGAVQNAADTVTGAARHPLATAKKIGGYAMTGMKIAGAAVLSVTLLSAFAPAAAVAGTAGAAGTASTLNTAVITDYFQHNLIDKLPAATETLTHAAQGAAGLLGKASAAVSGWLPPTP